MKKYFFLFFLLNFSSVLAAKEAVVCLHGFLRSYRCMIPMGDYLNKSGFSVYLIDYPTRRATIREHGHKLAEILGRVVKENPEQPIHFVTHSLGGVILRAALNHPHCPEEAKIGKAVLLAPPNQGSSLARHFSVFPPLRWIFGTKTGQELMTYEAEDIYRIGTFPQTMKVLVVSGKQGSRLWFHSPNDGKVSVEETKLETPHEHRVFPIKHNWIMTSREVIRQTEVFLSN